jgi:type II secretory pathway pseudopilin PulG
MTRASLNRGSKERGTLIVALMAGIAIMLILSAVAVQSWADVLRRDNEAEMMFRAQEIARALKRFQADRGKLPAELKELMEPGSKGQFFLRQLWKDPLVKDGKWQLLYLNPAGGIFDPTAPAVPPADGTTQPGSSPSLLNPPDAPTFPGLGTKTGEGAGEIAGLPIAGVKSKCKDRPFRHYKEKSEYNDWLFSIFDLDPSAPPQLGVTPTTPSTPTPTEKLPDQQ